MEYKQVNFDEITEAKKKKKVADSITYSTGYPDWDIAQFNKHMGTGGLGSADQIPHIPNGDTLPNGPVADAGSSDGASDAGSSAGEGGAVGENLAEALSNVTLDQVLARVKPEYQEIIKNTLLQLKDHYLKLSSEEQDKALDNLVDFVWFNKDFPMPAFEEAAIDPSEAEYYDEKGLGNIAIDFVVPPELYMSVEESLKNKLTEASGATAYTYGRYDPELKVLKFPYFGENTTDKNVVIGMAKGESLAAKDALMVVFECPQNIIKDKNTEEILKQGTAIKAFKNGNETTEINAKEKPEENKSEEKPEESKPEQASNSTNTKLTAEEAKAALEKAYPNNARQIKLVLGMAKKAGIVESLNEGSEEYLNNNLQEDVTKELKIQNNENIEKDIEELEPPIDPEYFPNNMGINLSSVKKEIWVQQDDGQLKSVEVEFDPAEEKEKLTEAHLDYYTQKAKMQGLENRTRGFNAAAASDEKLEYNWRLCKDENLPYARSVMEAEMKRRGGRLAALLKPKANLNVVITEDDITSRGLETVRGLVQPSDLPKYYSFKIAVIHLLFALFSNKTDIANAIRDEILAAWDGINLQQLKDILTNTINNKDVTAKIKNICAGYNESLKEDTVYSHREEKSFKLPNEISLINQKTVEDFIKSLAPEEEFKVGYVTPVYFYKELENLFTLIKATELIGYTGMDYRDVIADKNVADHSDRVANAQRQIDTYKDGAWGQKLNKDGEKFSTSYRATNKLALNPLKANSADEYEEVTDAAGNIVLDNNGERVYKTDANGEKIVKQHYDLSKILFYPEVGSTPVVHYYLDLRDGQGFRKVKRELLVNYLYKKVMEMAFARDNAVSQADAKRVVKYGFKDIKDFADQYPGLTFDNYLKAIKNGEDPAEWNKNHPFSSRWTIGDFTLKVQKMLTQDAATISSAQLNVGMGMNRDVTAYEDKPQVRALYSNQVYYLDGRPGTYGKVLSEDLDEGIVFSDNAQRCQIKDLIDSPEGRLILKRLQVGREGNGDSLGFGSYPRYLKADEIEKLKDEWIYYEDSGDCWYARFEKPVNEIRAILGLEPQDEFGRSIKKDESLELKEAKHYAPTFHIDYTIKGEDWEESIDIEAESETEAIEILAEKENVAFEDIEVNNCWQWTSDDFARAEDNRKQWDDMFYNEALELKEAKRYVKRYYVRPQNIFCSNKEDILKALIRIGDENCSIYSLKNLGDHDDVHLLKPEDIIYYYDDHVLYDKNHVQVMDYDLFVKHEEERKKYANIDAASDADFNQEYDDRLTTASLKDKEAVANYRAINKKDIK